MTMMNGMEMAGEEVVEEGKMKSISLLFDARPYEAFFKRGATAG